MFIDVIKKFTGYLKSDYALLVNHIKKYLSQTRFTTEIKPLFSYLIEKFLGVIILAILAYFLWFVTSKNTDRTSVNIISIITALIAILILFFDAYKNWEASLDKKLSIFFIEEVKIKDNKYEEKTTKCTSIKMAYIRASLTHEGDIRALGQQLGMQMLKLFITSHKKVEGNVIGQTFLDFDPGEITSYKQKNLLQRKGGSPKHIVDHILFIKLHKFHNSIKTNLPKKAIEVLSDQEIESIVTEFDTTYLLASPSLNKTIKAVQHSNCMNGEDIPKQLFYYVKKHIDL